MTLRIVSQQSKIPYEASKWLKTACLLEVDEMASLLDTFGDVLISEVSRVVDHPSGFISKGDFLVCYQKYIEGLKSQEPLPEGTFAPYFSSVITYSKDALYALEAAPGKYLIRVEKPCLQLSHHKFAISEGEIHSGVHGKDCISWGILFSFPQLYLDPKTKEIIKVQDPVQFPNVNLYKLLTRWIRENTLPTPFEYEGKKMNASIRLGKKCVPWINQHPQLRISKLRVG